MRKLIALCAMWFIFGAAAVAQQYPKGEVFVGYSHEIVDLDRSQTGLDGVHLSAAENMNSWFGALLDFSVHFKDVNGTTVHTETVAFGPQVAYRKATSVTPSAHAEVGVAHGSQGFLGNSTSGTHFAFVAGGALDYKLRGNFAIRVIQADWVRTWFQDLPRNNVRLSAGLLVRFDFRRR